MPTSARARPRGRPPDPRKREAILRAATRLFLARGYAGASLDAVAAAARVSKPTVYAHYGDKEGLFQAVVRARCDAYNRPADFEGYAALPVDEALRRIGRNFLALLLSAESLRLGRAIVAEAERRPRVARLFFEAGPDRAVSRVSDFLRESTRRGVLDAPDADLAAAELLALLKGKIHYAATLGLRLPRPESDVERHGARSVATFLRAYGPGRTTRVRRSRRAT